MKMGTSHLPRMTATISNMAVEFVIWLKPVPASRPRVARNGGVFYPKTHASYYQELKKFFEGDVPSLQLHAEAKYSVEIDFVLPAMKTSKHPIPRQDIDNLCKLPIDAMTASGKYWSDDHQIVHWVATKRFTKTNEEPHTRIIVRGVY